MRGLILLFLLIEEQGEAVRFGPEKLPNIDYLRRGSKISVCFLLANGLYVLDYLKHKSIKDTLSSYLLMMVLELIKLE